MLLWLDLVVLEWRLFLILGRGLLMSVARLLMRLIYELEVLWVVQSGYPLLEGGALLVLVHWLGLYMSQNTGPRSLCIHSFSIIDDLLFLLLIQDY